MTTPVISPSFVSGEVSPSLFGHVDLARLKSSAATMRNMFVRYTGGAYSRAGTALVGYSKQTGRAVPPKLLPFQFNIDQGLCLEFGNFYMRVVYDGAFVTESALPIAGATRASPCVISAPATGGVSAAPVNTAVYLSYAPGDTVTLAGGAYSVPATLRVATTKLLGVAPHLNVGSGYAPGDTVTLSGGVATTAAQIAVSSTRVNAASVANGGSGGANGTATVTGTTGTGTKFQASVTIAGGAIAAVNSITVAGAYTVNPAAPAAEPVTGGGLAGATLSLAIGIASLTLANPGVFTANPSGGAMAQAATSGAGTGATFIYGLFGPNSVAFVTAGSYTAFPANPVQQASTSGGGAGAQFTVASNSASAYAVGDWVYLSGVGGMTQLNGRTCVIGAAAGGAYSLYDVFGAPIDATAFSPFTAGGSASRIYTLATPWAEADLEYLKITQSADVVSIGCVNQDSGAEYPPYDLTRATDSSWTLAQVTMEPTVAAPPWCTLAATAIPPNWQGLAVYEYVVTAVNPTDGSESLPSPIGALGPAVDISIDVGTVTVTWGAVAGVNQYNVYKATPSFGGSGSILTLPPVGALFGFAGSAYGTQFLDQNITQDFSQVPPTHQDPFARGTILGATPLAVGGGYSSAFATINSATGSEAALQCVIVNGQVVAFVLQNPGRNYAPGDTVTITGDGAGATATLSVGAQSGTYPGVVGYYQERRVYANSLNNPDTYWMSQPGAFKNFDLRIPTIDTDAITGTPWSQQVNGVQFMISMPGGLVVLTGLGAWQVTGAGGSSLNPQAITPASQQAQPQAYNGCSSTVPPIKIDYDILYVQAKGSIYRDLAYQFFTNIYTGTDLTINSSHMFLGYTIREHAWCEEPYRTLWSVRNDGAMLSLTYLKPQEVSGWSRHDTNGLFKSVCNVVEPPVDALYLAVQRTIGANQAYFIERMDDRLWTGVESTWCVDCGLALTQPAPSATLAISSPTGIGALTGVTNLVGGANYSAATTAYVVDANGQGPGAGAVPTLTIIGGAVAAVAFAGGQQGAGYVNPQLVFVDPANAGSGASAAVVLSTQATFATDQAVFSNASVGQVIRAAGGVATITAFTNARSVSAAITTPFSSGVQPNSGGLMQAQPAGAWTLTTPTATIAGLYHLAGATVTGIADGNVIPPTVVPASGTLALPNGPASAVKVGLGFQAQFQSVYLDAGEPTVQGQRKKVAAATVRIESSRGLKAGSNQPDGSTLSPPQLAPLWQNLDAVPDLGPVPYGGNVTPLYTGDVRVPVSGGYGTKGQVALQQDNPLPMQVLALIPEVLTGDEPEQHAQQQGGQGGGRQGGRQAA